MPTPLQLPFGNTLGGLNTAKDPTKTGFQMAAEAVNVDLSTGVLQGAYGPGTALSGSGLPLANTVKFIHFTTNDTWLSSDYADWAINDAPGEVTFTYPSGTPTTYYTNKTAGSTNPPRVRYGTINDFMGLRAPGDNTLTVSSGTAASGTINRSYVALFSSPDGLKSNPSNRLYWNSTNKAVLDLDASNAYTKADEIDWYATENDDPDGTLYYWRTTTLNLTTNTVTDDLTVAVDLTQELTWGEGGIPTNTALPDDHKEPPDIDVLAESFYTPDDSENTGILFMAKNVPGGSTIHWSRKGSPQYVPALFFHKLPFPTEAIIAAQGQALVFTTGGVWGFSGPTDYAVSPYRFEGALGVRSGFGKTCADTPYGVLYWSRQGLTLFSQGAVRVLTEGLIDPAPFNSTDYTHACAAYFDGFYFLSLYGEGELWVFDLRELGAIKVSKASLDVAAMTTTVLTSNTYGMTAPSLYVVDRATGNVYPWRPGDGSQGGTIERSTWTYKTGNQAGSTTGDPCRFRRIWGDFTGPLTITAEATGYKSAKTHTKTIADGEAVSNFWLPVGFTGRHLSLSFEGTGAGSTVRLGRVEGVTFNGY